MVGRAARATIARLVTEHRATAASFTVVRTVDVSDVWDNRRPSRDPWDQQHPNRLTFTEAVLAACGHALHAPCPEETNTDVGATISRSRVGRVIATANGLVVAGIDNAGTLSPGELAEATRAVTSHVLGG